MYDSDREELSSMSNPLGYLTNIDYAEEFKSRTGHYPQWMPSRGEFPNRKWVSCPNKPTKPKSSIELRERQKKDASISMKALIEREARRNDPHTKDV